jgi:hypothetical protein
MKIIVLILTFIFIAACRTGDTTTNSTAANSVQTNANTATSTSTGEFAVGDKVLYHSNTGQRFYEATITNLVGKKASLKDTNNETVEADVSDVYRVPKAGENKNIKAGDIVAARFGQTAVWSGAEVTAASGDKITIKWLATGKTDEVSADNILTLSGATQIRVKNAFKT